MIINSSSPLSGLQGCKRFQSSAVNYTTMLLEAESERVYVGARGAVFALNASDISASSALTVSSFVPVLLHVVCLISLSLASFALHSTRTTFEATMFYFESEVFISPLQPLCVSECVVTLFLTQ